MLDALPAAVYPLQASMFHLDMNMTQRYKQSANMLNVPSPKGGLTKGLTNQQKLLHEQF